MVLGFHGRSDAKASACNAGDLGLIPGLGRSPGEGNGNPLQYNCLGNSTNRKAWWATVHGVAKNLIQLSDQHFQISPCPSLTSIAARWGVETQPCKAEREGEDGLRGPVSCSPCFCSLRSFYASKWTPLLIEVAEYYQSDCFELKEVERPTAIKHLECWNNQEVEITNFLLYTNCSGGSVEMHEKGNPCEQWDELEICSNSWKRGHSLKAIIMGVKEKQINSKALLSIWNVANGTEELNLKMYLIIIKLDINLKLRVHSIMEKF